MSGDIIEYVSLLEDIKGRIRRGQTLAVLSANRHMLELYWDVGRLIHARQKMEGWGAAVIPRLSKDLSNELPEIKGFSERNLKRMIRFYREYPTLLSKVPQAVALSADTDAVEKAPQPVAQIASSGDTGVLSMTEAVLGLPWGHYLMKGGSLAEAYAPHVQGRLLAISFITVGEMYFGAENRNWGKKKRNILEKTLRNFVVIPYDHEIARCYGRLVAERRRQGKPIAPNDAWIAACTVRHGVPLVTHNAKDFADISGLELVTEQKA